MSTKHAPLRSIVAALLVTLLAAGAAMAQSPTYQTRPRSSGGKAAQFGGAPRGGKGTAARSGVVGPAGGAAIQTAPSGAARPSVGSLAPSAPIKGGTPTGGTSKTYGAQNIGGGGNAPQIFSADQLKSGPPNNGIFRPNTRR